MCDVHAPLLRARLLPSRLCIDSRLTLEYHALSRACDNCVAPVEHALETLEPSNGARARTLCRWFLLSRLGFTNVILTAEEAQADMNVIAS
jgi:hypothetical protein